MVWDNTHKRQRKFKQCFPSGGFKPIINQLFKSSTKKNKKVKRNSFGLWSALHHFSVIRPIRAPPPLPFSPPRNTFIQFHCQSSLHSPAPLCNFRNLYQGSDFRSVECDARKFAAAGVTESRPGKTVRAPSSPAGGDGLGMRLNRIRGPSDTGEPHLLFFGVVGVRFAFFHLRVPTQSALSHLDLTPLIS